MADEPDNDQTVSMEVPSELIAAEPDVSMAPIPLETEAADSDASLPADDEELPDVIIQAESVDPLGSTMQTGAITREMVESSNADLDSLDQPDVRTVLDSPAVTAPPTEQETPALIEPVTRPELTDGPQRVDTRQTLAPPAAPGGRLRLSLFILIAIAGSATAWFLYPVADKSASSALAQTY